MKFILGLVVGVALGLIGALKLLVLDGETIRQQEAAAFSRGHRLGYNAGLELAAMKILARPGWDSINTAEEIRKAKQEGR